MIARMLLLAAALVACGGDEGAEKADAPKDGEKKEEKK